jgi:hypothetical protein
MWCPYIVLYDMPGITTMPSSRDWILSSFLASALVVSWWLVRTLRHHHKETWADLGRPRLVDLFSLSREGRALVRFIWSARLAGSGDLRLIAPGWLFRALMVILLASGLFLLFPELRSN